MKRRLLVLIAVAAGFGASAGTASAASSPSVATGSASPIAQKSATLHGTVNPNGAKTSYRFEWGLTSSYGSVGPLRSAGSGTKPVSVHLAIGGLLPGTVYHYRLVAVNRVGSAAGADRKFKTKGNPPPYAATGPPIALSSTSATVTAVINPNGQQTTWYFEYGPSVPYTSRTIPSHTLPAGDKPVLVAQQLSPLPPGTIIHYRVVAVNRGITEYGSDATLMTYPSPRPVPTVRARTRPRRDRRRPFTFTTTGRVIGPSSIPAQYACSGKVSVAFLLGRHRVAREFVPLQPNCTFFAQRTFRHLPRHRHTRTTLRVLVRYLGNGYLAPRRARQEHVTLG